MIKRTYKPDINKIVIFRPYKDIELVYDMDLKDVVIFQGRWIESIKGYSKLKKIVDYKTRLLQIKDILQTPREYITIHKHTIETTFNIMYDKLIKVTSKSNANNIIDQLK